MNIKAQRQATRYLLEGLQRKILTISSDDKNAEHRYADDTTIMAENQEEIKNLLMKIKEESEKAVLNSAFKKIRSWHLVPSLYGK